MVWENETKLSRQEAMQRLNVFLGFVAACFGVIGFYLFYLQIIEGRYFYQLSEQNTAQLYAERSPRGMMFDCHGGIICGNRPVSRVLFYPFISRPGGSAAIRQEIDKVKSIMPDLEVDPAWYTSKSIVCLAENISLEDMFRILEQRTNLPNIFVIMEQRRHYPNINLASHIVGYVSEINERELSRMKQEGYKLGDIIGKSGLEKQYDPYLRGNDGGVLVETNAAGRQLKIIKKIDPVQGNSLYLTIDLNLQKIAERELKKTGCAGAVVVLDPKSGAVKAMASSPAFDPNVFNSYEETGSESSSKAKYLKDRSLPLYNRAIQGQYTPGSVFKIITSLAAIDGKHISPDKTHFCTGKFQLGRKVFKCWKPEGHGLMSLIPGIKNSCDVYFYNTGLETGVDLIVEYARKFRMDERTGIDLPSEKAGFLPTQAWQKKRKSPWYDGDTVNLSIGQGYLLFTPIELANMVATVANKGTIWRPYIVSKAENPETGEVVFEAQPEEKEKIEISAYAWNLIEKGLFEVVDSGTGYGAHVNGIKIAGKTGTAQNPLGQDHALFVAYAPVDNPRIALAVVVEHGGKGGAVAAPIAGEILKAALKPSATGQAETVPVESD